MNTRTMLRAAGACGLAAASFLSHADGSAWSARIGVHDVMPLSDTSLAVGKLGVKDKIGPTLNLDYRLLQHFEVDVLGALPFTHELTLNGSRIGSTQHLPPTLSLRWHPLDATCVIDPYIGVGVTYTMFRNESLDSGAHLKLDNTVGFAGSAGIDWNLSRQWLVGVDARYLQIEPKGHINGGDIGTVKINPVAVGVTVGYRF